MSPPRISSACLYVLTGTTLVSPCASRLPPHHLHTCLFSGVWQSSLLNKTRGKLQRAAEIPRLGTVPTMRTSPSHMMGAFLFQARSPYL